MLSKEAGEQLKKIVLRDYGEVLSDDQVQELGSSLLRLTRVGVVALARAKDKPWGESCAGLVKIN